MVKKAKYPYHSDIYVNPADKKKVIAIVDRPKIPIRLLFNHKFYPTSAPVLCLLDSGSDRNLFPAHWGESLGIKVKSVTPRKTYGIGKNSTIAVFPYSGIKFHVGYQLKADFTFLTEVDFSYDQEIPLLGREGFFKFFKKITFIDNSEIVLEIS